MQVVNLKRDADAGFILSIHVGWVWTAQEKSTDSFNNDFFDILIIEQSGVVVFFPFLFLVSSRTLSHMTPNILFSRPTEILPET